MRESDKRTSSEEKEMQQKELSYRPDFLIRLKALRNIARKIPLLKRESDSDGDVAMASASAAATDPDFKPFAYSKRELSFEQIQLLESILINISNLNRHIFSSLKLSAHVEPAETIAIITTKTVAPAPENKKDEEMRRAAQKRSREKENKAEANDPPAKRQKPGDPTLFAASAAETTDAQAAAADSSQPPKPSDNTAMKLD